MEILKDSGVKCKAFYWARAKRCTVPTQFVRLLMVGIFDHETLLESTLKGGSSKTAENATPRKALDERKVNAIYGKLTLIIFFKFFTYSRNLFTFTCVCSLLKQCLSGCFKSCYSFFTHFHPAQFTSNLTTDVYLR